MTRKYYVARNKLTDHIVYKDGCREVMAQNKRKYIGKFNNYKLALDKAKRKYPNAKMCKHCHPEEYENIKEIEIRDIKKEIKEKMEEELEED